MLPVVIATAQCEVLLGPDDLRTNIEAGILQPARYLSGVKTRMPDVQSTRSSFATLPD